MIEIELKMVNVTSQMKQAGVDAFQVWGEWLLDGELVVAIYHAMEEARLRAAHRIRPAGSPTYTEPMVVFGIAKSGDEWRSFEPYCLHPDGRIDIPAC